MSATAEQALQATARPVTFQLIDPEKQLEWVNGRTMVKEPGGARNSRIGVRLSARLGEHI